MVGSIAMQSGRRDIMLQCLRGGMLSPSDRTSLFRQFMESRSRENAVLQNRQSQSVSAFYVTFVQEYRRVLSVVSSNAYLDTLQQQLSDHRSAWKCGIRALRGISGGNLPQDLGDVIAFLCVCKAVSATLDLYTASEYTRRFLADLHRWGIVFDTQASFDLYREAVRDIWEVELSMEFGNPPIPNFDIDLLQYAQGLVSALVHEAGVLIEPTRDCQHGLEQSQQRWRERRAELPPFMGNPELAEPKPPDGPSQGTPHFLRKEIFHNIISVEVNTKLAVLMTGAIFTILLVFLVCRSRS